MNSDTSDLKENNNTREGGIANYGTHYPPTPESCGTTVDTSTKTLTTTTTNDLDNKKTCEDWRTQNKNKNSYKKEKITKSQHFHKH